MRNSTGTFIRTVACCWLAVAAPALFAQTKAIVVPDSFLRGYDPVTVLYDAELGPAGGGPVAGPSPFLSIEPALDGEYRWEDSRTIRFLPSVPWPPLRNYTVNTRGGSFKLTTMIAAPISVSPRPSSTGMEPFSSIVLTFPAPLGAEALRSMIAIELRDLPGISDAGAVVLPSGSFEVTELEANKTPSKVSYRVSLNESVPYGKRVVLKLMLSSDPTVADAIAEYRWDTKAEFRLVAVGGGSTRLPVSATGAAYADDQAVDCGTGTAPLFLEFSDRLGSVNLEAVKRAISFSPAVRNLSYEVSNRRMYLRFDSDRERLYKLSIAPGGFVSSNGRNAASGAKASFHFYYRQGESFVAWKVAEGIVERYGPRQIPMESRGVGRLDLRIHRIDPLSWDYQPFPRSPVAIDEDSRPPMPGEEPAPGTNVAAQIRLLGSPPISKLVDLPVSAASPRSTWGLDIGPELDARFGEKAPGTYLVGYRVIGSNSTRYWAKATVTDLSLTGAEEERAVQFLVTTLSGAVPVPGATIRVEGRDGDKAVTLVEGLTDARGRFRYEHRRALSLQPVRVVVAKGDDVLVIRCDDPPPSFANNHWSRGRSWLSWLASDPRTDREAPRHKGWITTERPVYRPGETVHAVGWIRDWRLGRIERYTGEDLVMKVTGPDDKTWVQPLEISRAGSVSYDFSESDIPTGDYRISLMTAKGQVYSTAPFKVLSYRIPLFEVNISGPDKVPLDKPFEMLLTADYYSGGRVTGEEATWEIEQYPWALRSTSYPGFVFSTDERFAATPRSAAVETGTRSATLDQDGSARLSLDPRLERDGRARRYVISGTVRGADRQAVTQSRTVYALPPFSVGLAVPRLVKEGLVVDASFIAVDHEERAIAGKDMKVSLIQRQWHSYVAETDFTTGEPKYVSEAVDVPVTERTIESGTEAKSLSFTVPEPGVYVLEVSSLDYLGRRIAASSDFFVSAEGAVAWERKTSGLFTMSADKDEYAPGETATILLESPYQEGWALVAVEEPDGNRYESVRISGGRGLLDIPVKNEMAPRFPIQALLYRGRIGAPPAGGRSGADLGKPSTVGASLTLKVKPEQNRIAVTLDHPKKATPGQDIQVTITAADESGRPLDGDATLWLVDKAVLSLGAERDLDPLPAFLDRLASALRLVDTRNRALGYLPVAEVPGGDGMDEYYMGDLFSRSTVRKNLKTVPYFKTGIPVRNGKAVVDIQLPDNLTEFAVRAVVTSGFERFGAARSALPVRLAVALQNVVPRFIRPNDSAVAGGTARVVEGDGGAAEWAAKLNGIVVAPGTVLSGRLVLPPKDAVRLFFPFSAPADLMVRGGGASISLALERKSDRARDAFQVDLPVRPDSRPVTERARVLIDGKQTVTLPPPATAARPGTVQRTLTVATDERLLAIAEGLNFLETYPHGCLEQRTSQLYPAIAMADFLASLGLDQRQPTLASAFAEYRAYASSCQDDTTGLFSYWPGGRPSVSLTAYVVEFLVQGSKAGLRVDYDTLERAKAGLSKSLRSDSYLWDRSWADFERIQAFSSLQTAGLWERSYATRFLDKWQDYDLLSRARLYLALKAKGSDKGSKATALLKSLSDSLVLKKERNEEVILGAKDFAPGSKVLLTETRTLATVLEALVAADRKDRMIPLLADWIIRKAGDDGWGSTMDTVAALRALAAWNESGAADEIILELRSGDGKTERYSNKKARLASFVLEPGNSSDRLELGVRKGAGKKPIAVLVSTRYEHADPGSSLKAENKGFLVKRAFYLVKEDGSLDAPLAAVAGKSLRIPIDSVVEEKITVVNFGDNDFVAIEVPLAAGFEPLDPRLAGAPKDATPTGTPTLEPSYSMTLDDRNLYYYDSLPKGSYDFYFRVRASFEGTYTAPPARAELMYDLGTWGSSDGCGVTVTSQ